ncbi:uncharacterized protein LOC133781798 [Humulus lupulus]|uniref:uncharacterized protein LOC133781798 n=1 Tax=Humulus lupulus TaxID=3486 RepID=UPI002B40C0AF|nr:uncharacterized protein LOC133781798 [Humulus lupulus]
MALFVTEEEFELLEMEEDVEDLELSVWEFVDLEEDDNDDDDDDGENEIEDNGFGSGCESSPLEDHSIEARGVHILHRFGDGGYGYVNDHGHHEGSNEKNGDHDVFDENEGENEEYEDENEDDEDGSYGLNDELVPWSVSDKFGGRERMRKLGKRGFPKMFNSKKSPYLFVRPGVVRGKHGLGLKHSL